MRPFVMVFQVFKTIFTIEKNPLLLWKQPVHRLSEQMLHQRY